MRIQFLVTTLGEGGAERSLQELLPELERHGAEPSVVCFDHRAQGVESLVAGRYPFRVLRPGSRLGQVRELRSILREEKADLLHTTLFASDVFGRPAAASVGVPVVTSLVNMPYEPARLEHDRNVSRAKLAAVRTLETLTGRIGHVRFHAISQAVKDASARDLHIPRDRITVVHRGRDADRLGRRDPERRARVRASLGLGPDELVVLNVARQEYQKGQRFLLEGFGQADLPDARLLIAGRDGNASGDLAPLAAALGDRVRFLGHRDDVPDLMVAADLFVLSSLWEGLGGVVLEAMALELPILSTDLPPVREVTSPASAAALVPVGDAGAIADGIRRAVDRPDEQRAMAVRGRELFCGRYTIEKSGEAMFALFDRTLARR